MIRPLFASRWRVLLVFGALLLIFDGGRSLHARIGYARPTELWQPDPSAYADIAWPPGADVSLSAPLGQRVYAQRCAVCHGPDGRGNGPAAPSLIPRPRDFTRGLFKYKSTPGDQPPTDADLTRVVGRGLQASAMPYFDDLLGEAEIREVIDHVKGFSPAFAHAASAELTVPPRARPDAASIARGGELYFALGCDRCHGRDGRLGDVSHDAAGHPVVARDLSAPWTFAGGSEPEQVWLRLTSMSSLSPMPSYADVTTAAQRWDVVNFVLSLARTPAWQPGGRLEGPGQQTDALKRGRYLVHAEMCGLCHTQISRSGIYRPDAYLAGGMRVGAYPHGVFVSRNLTSDPETGLGRWSEAEIAEAIRDGRARGRALTLWAMPWMYLHHLADDDARAVATYLKTLPHVRNAIPDPLHYGVVETLASKLMRPLPAADPTVLTYMEGNFGEPTTRTTREWPQRVLVGLQWLVVAVGVVAFVLAAPRGRRLPRKVRGWLLASVAMLGIAAGWLVGFVVYRTPTLTLIPPAEIVKAVTASILPVDAARVGSHEQAVLAERGRYLFTVASCALCHGNDGGGGAKISWRPMGTVWSRNLTPDRETGIGAWSDAEIARAIRSGVTPAGRTLHWQAMIWDHASGWDEEDVAALIAYLRVLPALRRPLPPARGPATDDCEVYTFWVARSLEPGCR